MSGAPKPQYKIRAYGNPSRGQLAEYSSFSILFVVLYTSTHSFSITQQQKKIEFTTVFIAGCTLSTLYKSFSRSFSCYLHSYTCTIGMRLPYKAITGEINVPLSEGVIELEFESSEKRSDGEVQLRVCEPFSRKLLDACNLGKDPEPVVIEDQSSYIPHPLAHPCTLSKWHEIPVMGWRHLEPAFWCKAVRIFEDLWVK